MARRKASIEARIESNMDEIARAERNAQELLAFRSQIATLYHQAGMLIQSNLDLAASLRESNLRLKSARRATVAA